MLEACWLLLAPRGREPPVAKKKGGCIQHVYIVKSIRELIRIIRPEHLDKVDSAEWVSEQLIVRVRI